MDHVFLSPISRVAVTGGTHGNELSGVYIVREMQKKRLNQTQVGSLSLSAVLSNPRATEVCRRYIDKDLNRCFTEALLSTPLTDSSPYELRRAHELNAQLGPKGSEEAVDLVCDLHNTTSNLGLCFIIDNLDWAPLHIFKYIQSKMPTAPVSVVLLDRSMSEPYSVDSVAKHGFGKNRKLCASVKIFGYVNVFVTTAIEVGPQPHGVLRADIYNMMKEAVDHTIEWLHKFNAGSIFEGGDIETFVWVKTVDYPRDPETSELTAAIHPQLQDNDLKLLRHGDPIFLLFTGETVKYEGEELHPFFVNECAYYEKKIAFHLGKKKTVTIPPISVKRD